MANKQTFPVPGCSSCQHYQEVGGLTRYCSGGKRRKPKRFRRSDPQFKAPKWCPKRISPPICRIYGFRDDCSDYMEMLWRQEYDMGRSKSISPSSSHYKLRIELPLGKTAKQFHDSVQAEPLSDVLPDEVNAGEIIEIDDGLKPYFFYVLSYGAVIPLPYFQKPKT